MKIALFTSNQTRHLSFINRLSAIADELYVVSEVTTLFPGHTEDFYKKSDVMKSYFFKMQEAERKVFGEVSYLRQNVNVLPVKMGDVNSLPMSYFDKIKDADYVIVFGASWIKDPLCEFLINKKAVNIHMGTSPYYRGAACNFWALYDKKPEFVGATIHYLTKGLDSGGMIMHAFPKLERIDGFELGMKSVQAAHEALAEAIQSKKLFSYEAQVQDKTQQMRYAKRVEFDDKAASEYLNNPLSPEFIFERCSNRSLNQFLRPYIANQGEEIFK